MSIRLVALVAAAVAVATAAPPSQAAPRPAYVWSGTGCDEAVVTILAPLSTLQAALPPGYTARPDSTVPVVGRLYLGVVSCRRLTVDGRPQAARTFSDAGISVVPPKGMVSAVYHLWQVTSASELRAKAAKHGLHGALVPALATAFTPGTVGSRRAAGNVPWPGNEHEIEIVPRNVEQWAYDGGRGTWLHETRRGRIRTEYQFSPGTYHQGPAKLQTPPSTALAAIIGTQVAPSGSGYWYTFDITADVYLDRR